MDADFEQQCAALIGRLQVGDDIDVEFVADQFGLSPEVACKAFVIALAIVRALALAEQRRPPRPLH